MEFKDYYAVLGVAKDATADEIKKTYRQLARKYHPDVSKEPDAKQRMPEINEAYEVLADPEKRAAYNTLSERRARAGAGSDFEPPPGWDAGFEFSDAGASAQGAEDFSDFFNSLFGQAARAGRARRREPPSMRGSDHHASILIDLEDSYHGATRPITLRAARLDDDGRVVTDERTLNVEIPKGVREGQSIRLRGQGGPAIGNAPAGDLYLEVHFRPDPRYRIEGRNVTERVPIAPWEGALGAAIEVPTPAGTVEVRVPAGSSSGRKLRLKGRGIPGEPAGDLYLELEIVLPSTTSEHEREHYEALARESRFNPRQSPGA